MKKILIAFVFIFASFGAQANYLMSPTPMQHVPSAPVSVSVTTSSTQGVAINANRTALECTNIGTSTAFLAYGANAAVLSSGTAIAPGVTWWMDDYLFTTAAVNVIGAASTTLSCQEMQ